MTLTAELTATDLFCGAGGSSLGAESSGIKLAYAANHWATAVEVHQSHFPDAGHDLADISQADPRRYPRTDILMASPECTNHSQARGVSRKKQDPTFWDSPDPAAERSRATMWDVVRFSEQLRYDVVIVENVVEACKWVGWRAWHVAMADLGYSHRVLSHNSMHHGVAQSRDRIFVVFWRNGINIDLDMQTVAWCQRCDTHTTVRQAFKNGRRVGRYRQQWVWSCSICAAICDPATRPASDIIDWELDCPRIGDRKRPLARATRARILAGLQRYGFAPVITAGAGNTYETTPGNRARPLSQPLAVQQATATHAIAMTSCACNVVGAYVGVAGTVHRSTCEWFHGVHSNSNLPCSFLMNTAHSGRIHDMAEPHPTVCASDDRLSLIVPLRRNGHAYRASEPVHTVTAGGTHHGLLMRNNGGGAEMVTPLDEPARTMTTAGHQSLLMPYDGPGQDRSLDRSLPVVTKEDRRGFMDAEQVVDDCGFRMLEPHEIAAAMAFPKGYIPSNLPKKHQVRLAGNAVTPPVMAFITERVRDALAN